MSQQQLFCVADDRHRAVVLTGCLADLGNPVERIDHPANPTSQPALVLWTRRAARTPWLIDLFERFPATIALVIDDVPVSLACRRAVRLENWPARSADASVGALVRWLQDPERSASPFSGSNGAAKKDSAQIKPGNKVANKAAYLVISVCLLLLITLVITQAGPQPERGGEEPFRESTTATVDTPAEQTSLVQSVRQVTRTAGNIAEGDLPARSTPPKSTNSEGIETADPYLLGKSTAGRDSLSHLCRARTPQAALAWYRVLTSGLKRSVLHIDCVQALLARPGFAVLEAQFQA